MGLWWVVALGGAAGALARHALAVWVEQRSGGPTPLATGVVNLVGCFVLGALLGALPSLAANERWRLLLGVGVLGSFTTFSTWTLDSLQLLEQGRWAAAATNIVVQVLAGLLALALGRALMIGLLR